MVILLYKHIINYFSLFIYMFKDSSSPSSYIYILFIGFVHHQSIVFLLLTFTARRPQPRRSPRIFSPPVLTHRLSHWLRFISDAVSVRPEERLWRVKELISEQRDCSWGSSDSLIMDAIVLCCLICCWVMLRLPKSEWSRGKERERWEGKAKPY